MHMSQESKWWYGYTVVHTKVSVQLPGAADDVTASGSGTAAAAAQCSACSRRLHLQTDSASQGTAAGLIDRTTGTGNVQPLEFCNWYRKESCCLPAFDVDIYEHFAPLIAAGDTCAKYQNKAKYYLSLVFCYGCDPEEPTHFTAPLNDAFFNASIKTAKICSSVTKHMAPAAFSDCGLTIADDREDPCSGTSPIAPAAVWFDCDHGQYMCLDSDKNWYCSGSACGADNTPLGFMDVPCNASEHTCDAALMFLNDNRGAKPPNYNDYPVEIVDEVQCLETHGNSSKCKCLRNPSKASSIASAGFLTIVTMGMIALVS